MPNANTFAVAPQFGGNSGQGASSGADFQFADGQSTAVRLRLRLPPGSTSGSRLFRVKAGGRVETGAAAGTFLVTLYHGDSSTIGSNTIIEASTAREVATGDAAWYIEAVLQTDADEQDLHGKGWSIINSLLDAEALVDNIATSVDPDAEIAFTVVGNFEETADTTQNAVCDFFEAEAL
ncbi:hypothetical protein LCGC14_1756250 [marine sediment metagenome]|uniref:Uncharacterized protein n=1 Tax=marine sediment metagenome TaxID=412755 RepID=A0A0F9H2F8_9ZZZZ